MPSINATGRDLALATQSSRQGGNARQGFSNDLDTFLTLLTTQLANQDPLSPMDSTEFTSQLVQFAQVEQSISRNEKLDQLLTAAHGSLAVDAMRYIGRTVEGESDILALQNGAARFAYGFNKEAKTVNVTIKDSNNKVIKTFAGETSPGVHELNWDGTNDKGTQMPDGTYSIAVTALGEQGSIDSYSTVFARINGVTTKDGEVVLIADKVGIPLSKVLSISEASVAEGESLESAQMRYLGKKVEHPSETLSVSASDTEAKKIVYTLPQNATEAKITITDASGTVVRVLNAPIGKGRNTVEWDRKNSAGTVVPAGKYAMSITTKALHGGYDLKPKLATISPVLGITVKDGQPAALIPSGSVPTGSITSVFPG